MRAVFSTWTHKHRVDKYWVCVYVPLSWQIYPIQLSLFVWIFQRYLTHFVFSQQIRLNKFAQFEHKTFFIILFMFLIISRYLYKYFTHAARNSRFITWWVSFLDENDVNQHAGMAGFVANYMCSLCAARAHTHNVSAEFLEFFSFCDNSFDLYLFSWCGNA